MFHVDCTEVLVMHCLIGHDIQICVALDQLPSVSLNCLRRTILEHYELGYYADYSGCTTRAHFRLFRHLEMHMSSAGKIVMVMMMMVVMNKAGI